MGDLSRRSFLTGAAALAGMAATAGLAGCAPQQASGEAAAADGTAASSVEPAIGETPAWLGQAPDIAASDIVNTMDTELLIVGAGNAGMAAAAYATDLGIDFIVAEKAGAVGATRNWYGAVNVPECTEAGKEVDTVKLNNVLRQAFGGKNDMRVVKTWLDESADMHAWVRPRTPSARTRSASTRSWTSTKSRNCSTSSSRSTRTTCRSDTACEQGPRRLRILGRFV